MSSQASESCAEQVFACRVLEWPDKGEAHVWARAASKMVAIREGLALLRGQLARLCAMKRVSAHVIRLTTLGCLQLIVLIADLMKRQPSARPSAAEAYRCGPTVHTRSVIAGSAICYRNPHCHCVLEIQKAVPSRGAGEWDKSPQRWGVCDVGWCDLQEADGLRAQP